MIFMGELKTNKKYKKNYEEKCTETEAKIISCSSTFAEQTLVFLEFFQIVRYIVRLKVDRDLKIHSN